MTTYILYGCGTVLAGCLAGIVLLLGYLLCSYVASQARNRSSKKWTDQ